MESLSGRPSIFNGNRDNFRCKTGSPNAELTFNGLSLHGTKFNGVTAASGKAADVSESSVHKVVTHGVPFSLVSYFANVGTSREATFDYSKSGQKEPDEGAIPEGTYWTNICAEYGVTSGRHGLFGSDAWGNHSWRLNPEAGTNTPGRGGFNIHGGNKLGSGGCIDIGGNDSKLHDWMEGLRKINKCCCYVLIHVKYEVEKASTKEFIPNIEGRFSGLKYKADITGYRPTPD